MTNPDYADVIRQVADLCLREPDEKKPYDFKYQAAELCKQAVEQGSGKALAEVLAAPPADAADEVYVLLARRGLSLMETDLLADGQQCIETAMKQLSADEAKHLALLLECYNALGALQSGRDDLQGSLRLLESAEALYKRQRPHGGHAAAESQGAQAAGTSADGEGAAAAPSGNDPAVSVDRPNTVSACASKQHEPAGAPATDCASSQPASTLADGSDPANSKSQHSGTQVWDDAEKQHTSTLFFLAQAHGHAGHRTLSAHYCAATLTRQLESGQFQLQEWMQNCMQLSGYYVASNAHAIAQYCLLAASQVAERAAKGLLVPLPVKTKGAAQQQQDEGIKTYPLDPDVAANLELAWAKWYMARLVASHEAHIDNLRLEMPYKTPAHFPEMLILRCLELPDPATLAWGEAALAKTFEQARDLFNAGMTHYKKALEYYELDGWVTEHCNTQMEISNLYRCLASFEPDVHRKRLMHRQRVARLQPLHGVLNPEFFLGLVRSIALELGNVSREIIELEEQEGRPPAKIAATRLDAIKYYQDFINTFRSPMQADGTLPDRVDDAANERFFLMASFSLGRVMAGRMADRDFVRTAQACELLTSTADYVQRHNVEAFQREAQMSREMAALIREKLELTQRVEAAAGSK